MPALFEASTLSAVAALIHDKRRLRTAEYHRRAHEASAQADASVLNHVREKHKVAAARWTDLALMNESAGLASSAAACAPDRAPSRANLISEEASCAS